MYKAYDVIIYIYIILTMNTRNVRFARICRSNIVQALSNITLCMIFKSNAHRRLSKINMRIRSGSVNTCTHNKTVYFEVNLFMP